MNYWMRVKALFKRKQLNRDLEDELAFHLAMREAKNRTRGIEGEEARYAARRHFGNVTRIKEACREAWSFVSLESTWRDLWYGARALAKNPGFTAVAVLAIALGIGVNTGIFSVLYGVALKLLPVPRADQIVSVSDFPRQIQAQRSRRAGDVFLLRIQKLSGEQSFLLRDACVCAVSGSDARGREPQSSHGGRNFLQFL